MNDSGPAWCRVVDAGVSWIGRATSWVVPFLMLVILVTVLAGHRFPIPNPALSELQWQCYGLIIMVGIAWAQVHDRHVRLDLLRRRFAPRTRRWIEVAGILLLQLPFLGVFAWQATAYTWQMVGTGTGSTDGGIPWFWPAAAAMPLGAGLCAAAAIARCGRCLTATDEPDGAVDG